MIPNAPIQNFKIPRLADNGYTQWVLQGAKGTYESAEQVRIEDMGLRVYTGDERMALEMRMDSPEAIVRIQENKAYSESTIEIVGSNFKISGVGWTWDGTTKEIEVLFDTVVQFTQTISDSFGAETSADPTVAPKTVIHSQRLKLTTTETEYQFEFKNNVHVVSGDMDMKGNVLIAIVDAPKDSKAARPKVEGSKLDAVRKIIARDDVVIEQKGRIVRAGEAEFFPREKKVNLSGTPVVEASGVYMSGATIRSQEGEIVVTGGGEAGRAQMILTETGGLGIQGGSALAEETIVLADSITMLELETENQFLFAGSVAVMSGAVQMRAKDMTIFADKSVDDRKAKDADKKALAKNDSAAPKKLAADDAEDAKMKVGDVRRIVADGGVQIEQNGQIATSERVTFYPAEERAVLEGSPRVTNGEAIVTGEKMELQPSLAIILGSAAQPVNVVLPEMPNLGYDAFTGVARANSPKPLELKEKSPPSQTVVSSQLLRMLEEPTRTVFRFTENVKVTGTNLEASCELLDVVAIEKKTKDGKSGDLKERLEVQRIEAVDTVEVKQDGRVATADKAFILPQEGKVILEGNAVVNDAQGRVSGHRMRLLQGQRRAIVEGGGPKGERARITLPALPKGKF